MSCWTSFIYTVKSQAMAKLRVNFADFLLCCTIVPPDYDYDSIVLLVFEIQGVEVSLLAEKHLK